MRKKIDALLLALALLGAGAAQLPAQVVVEGPSRRGYLGFSFERTPGAERTLSLTVTDVVRESPAAKGGLQQGDVILRLNGLGASEALLNSISRSLTPGDTVTLRIRRDGRERELRLVAAQPPAGYFVARALPRLDSDSVRGMLRIFVDSMVAGLDTTHFRFYRDTTGGAHMFVFTDSAGSGDSVFVRRYMRQLPRGAAPFDSVFARMPLDSILRRFPPDSAFRHFPFDSLVRGQVRVFPGEGERVFEFTVPGGRGNVDNLMVFGMGARAVAGARLETLNPELARYFRTERGVLVLDVPENTPARRAGLRGGDVITSADGAAVREVGDVYRAFATAKKGTVKLEVLRQGERRTLELSR